MFHPRILVSALLLVMLLLAPAALLSAAPPVQVNTVTGIFSIVWGDPEPGSNLSPTIKYFLTDAQGNVTEIVMDENVAGGVGGILELDQQRVTLAGTAVTRPQGEGPSPLFRVQAIQAIESITSPTLTGPLPWLSLGCKFVDVPAEPKTLTYLQEMYKNSYPGLDHYWREQSFNKMTLKGSGAAAWFTLPHPKSYYLYSDGQLILHLYTDDCTAAADASVYFPKYFGINFVLNDHLDGHAFASSMTLNLDGVTKNYKNAWLPPWAYSSLNSVEHEMGHGFGFWHSDGHGNQYGNQWDVMSDIYSNCERSTDPTYGCLGQHTIGYHKSKVGWTTPLWLPVGSQTINLERLALPQTSNTQVVAIPIQGSTQHYYTVEARRRAGYDVKLPGEGVIIHKVDAWATVIDPDGENTGDDGAMWRPGELFADRVNMVFVCVNSQTPSGFNVTVAVGRGAAM